MGLRTEPAARSPAHQVSQESSIMTVSNEPGLPPNFLLSSTSTCNAPNRQLTDNDLNLGTSLADSSLPVLRFDSSALLKVTRAFDSGWYPPSHSFSTFTQSHLDNAQVSDDTSRVDCISPQMTSSKAPEPTDKIITVTSRRNPLTQLNSSFLDLGKEEEGKHDDPEGVKQLMWVSPTMDAHAPDNFLPSVLQNFAQWVPLVMFEPLRIIHCTKQLITGYFSSSDASRARIMLVGRVLGMLLNNSVLDNKGQSIVYLLRTDLNRETSLYTSTRPSLEPGVARIQAGRLLIKHLENITMQAPVYPLSTIFCLLRDAAPIFRYACPDPPGLPVYLPGILMETGFDLRHFVSLDVVLSVTSGRPTSCEYEIGSSLELCDRLLQYQEYYGFQWLHGVPDQFILLLAWINTLYGRQLEGVNVDPRVLAQIESDLSNVELLPVDSTDPALKIGRTVVQECWRHAVYVYLYMTLYGAHSKDPRVERALKGFMRLVNGINPGRNPDSFLAVPMIIAGVAASKQRDRVTIRRRILGLQECQNPASSWNDHVRILEDVWTRVSTEGRVAKWPDLKIACQKVTGI
ncbi:fungal-specific transcription factor domain protein [Rhizoctonia solani AG-3 Rhs1AP]|nr:fungal-specific transcription factor domain protein [Rhizoctonia solani AG-3 Rhs1AP]